MRIDSRALHAALTQMGHDFDDRKAEDDRDSKQRRRGVVPRDRCAAEERRSKDLESSTRPLAPGEDTSVSPTKRITHLRKPIQGSPLPIPASSPVSFGCVVSPTTSVSEEMGAENEDPVARASAMPSCGGAVALAPHPVNIVAPSPTLLKPDSASSPRVPAAKTVGTTYTTLSTSAPVNLSESSDASRGSPVPEVDESSSSSFADDDYGASIVTRFYGNSQASNQNGAPAAVSDKTDLERLSQEELIHLLLQSRLNEKSLQEQLDLVESKRLKVLEAKKAATIKMNKTTQLYTDLQASHQTLSEESAKQATENASLRLGLQNISAARDDLKMKLQTRNELLKSVRQENEDIAKKLRTVEKDRQMEQELLGYYRELAHHSGYYKWGKSIRLLEGQLAESNATAESSSSFSLHDQGNNGGNKGGGGKHRK
jgi:hypothetical protein